MKLFTIVLAVALLLAPLTAQEQLTPQSVGAALAAKPEGEAATRLASRMRGWFGAENLKKGPNPKIQELDTVWAIEIPGAQKVSVVSTTSDWRLPLARLGNSDVWAASHMLTDGTGMKWNYEVDGKAIGGGNLEVYKTHPDALEKPDAPKGKTTEMPVWKSNIFPGTERKWWVYVPAQYAEDKPAAVMVFQDGGSYKSYVPTIFDNLIAKGDMPVTVGVFIEPGVGPDGKKNRSFEYDTLSDQYARFLLEEILPEVEKTTKLKRDAASRAICGASSGGICAFTVAWQKPEEFGKVVSWIGSFTNIAHGATLREGGHNYEALIRKTPKKPIRVFLQDGANDLDNNNGNWPLANQQMAKALAFAGYDYQFVYGQGFHNHQHGRAIFPDTLRWLWR
jgi:enterochelin esterase family protein